jgi:hypothetical protein
MSLFEELIEDRKEDEKIVKSFEPKDSLSDQIFEGSDGKFSMRDDIRKSLIKISDDFIETLFKDDVNIELWLYLDQILLNLAGSEMTWQQVLDHYDSNYPEIIKHVLP